MNKENSIKLFILLGFLVLFLTGSRFHAEGLKAECSEGKCSKPDEHGELNYHERFHILSDDNFAICTVKSCANFWEANATGMTFAIIIGGAALSLLLSWKKFEKILSLKGIKGAALGSIFGMPLNMCANCSAVTSVSMTSQNGSAEATLGIILGGALLNFIGIVTMFGLFHPAVVISRIVFSAIMILIVVPFIARWVKKPSEEKVVQSPLFNQISCYFPEKSFAQTIIKSTEDWLIAVGSIAWKLIPLMLLGTLLTAIFRVIFPNEFLQHITSYNSIIVIGIISFIGTLLSIPVMFEILLGTILLHLGFSNGAIAAMVFTAPSFGLFTLVLTKEKLGGLKVPLILIAVTFIFGIGAGLLTETLTKFF
ncbi:MAG: permease [Bacteroidetes bacterium]|nr:permease [Bacteroidota bacterium]